MLQGKNLYKVRWKGYTSEDDTWEPEVHLEDCKEVLLEFRKKLAENKAKAVRKDIQVSSFISFFFFFWFNIYNLMYIEYVQ